MFVLSYFLFISSVYCNIGNVVFCAKTQSVCNFPSPFNKVDFSSCKSKFAQPNICDPYDMLTTIDTQKLQKTLNRYRFLNCGCLANDYACPSIDDGYTVAIGLVQKGVAYLPITKIRSQLHCHKISNSEYEELKFRFNTDELPPRVMGTVCANYTRRVWNSVACETDILLLYIEHWHFPNSTRIGSDAANYHLFVSVSDRISHALNRKAVNGLDTLLFGQKLYFYRKPKIIADILKIFYDGLPRLSYADSWANFNLNTEFGRIPVWAILTFLICFGLIVGSVSLATRVARATRQPKMVSPEGDHVSLKMANQRSPARKTQEQMQTGGASTSLIFAFSRSSSRAGAFQHANSAL